MYDRPFLLRERDVAGGRRRGFGLVAGLGVVAAACASPLGGAVRAYEHARYPEAMDELRAVEAHVSRWGPSDSARFALYRGLAHLALGDVAATRFWFDRVEHAMRADPAILCEGDALRLASARAHLPP
jgi:hypothetical protein